MHISEITVRRPVLAAVISMFLVLLGLVSYDKLSIREYPDIDKPVVTVSTVYRGASAEIVERDITQILEDSLSGISNIKEIKSESKDEISSIRIEFTLSRDMEFKLNFIFEIFIDAIYYFSLFFFFKIIFQFTQSLGEFNQDAVIIFLIT